MADDEYLLSRDERYILAAIYIILAIPIFIFNAWILLAILFSKKLRCSTTNWIYFFLVAGDFLVFFSRIPSLVISLLSEDGWPDKIPIEICSFLSGLDVNNIVNTMCAMFLIAVNRWVKTTKSPATYHRWFNMCSTTVISVLLWIVKFTIAAVPPMLGFGKYGYSEKFETCFTDDNHKYNDYFAWFIISVSYPLQIIFTVYFFMKTFAYVRQETAKGTKIFDSRLLAVTRVHFYVSVTIIVLYLPFGVLYAIPEDMSYPYRHWGFLLVTFSSALNPIIYLIWHPDIRAVCREMYQAATTHGTDMRDLVI